MVALALLASTVLQAAPPTLEAGARVWRLAESEVRLSWDKHVASVHYTAAPTGAPEHQGPWVSVWATYTTSGSPSGPKPGNVAGLERVFDWSRWQEDQVTVRRGGVERDEKRRYIEATRAGIAYSVWPQDADPAPVLTALLRDGVELHAFSSRHISKCTLEQNDWARAFDVAAPDTWQMVDYKKRFSVENPTLPSTATVAASFLIEETRFIYGLRGIRREPRGPVAFAPIELRAGNARRQTVTDGRGWARLENVNPVPIQPPRPPMPKETRDGEFVLQLWQGAGPVTLSAVPLNWKPYLPGPQVLTGFLMDLQLPPRTRRPGPVR